jgi:nitrate reductase beta subunit
LALPLHPEFRTLPMVWYVPPLSPVRRLSQASTGEAGPDDLRIPVKYLANLLTAGDEAPVRLALTRLAALRRYMRAARVNQTDDEEVLRAVGLNGPAAREIHRLLALAPLTERFVVPSGIDGGEDRLYTAQGGCGFSD